MSKAAKIREYQAQHPDAPVSKIAKACKTTMAYVYALRHDDKKKLAKKAKTLPVAGKGNEYEAKDGKWQVVAVATSNTPVNADNVNHPAHYKVGGIETIDFIEAKKLNYHLGNVVKYVTRADHKGERLENLRKAQWYLNREIAKAQGA